MYDRINLVFEIKSFPVNRKNATPLERGAACNTSMFYNRVITWRCLLRKRFKKREKNFMIRLYYMQLNAF